MADKVAQMTVEELQEMIASTVESVIEQKLSELINDPDEGLGIRTELLNRLSNQQQSVQAGERGQSLEDVAKNLGIK